MQTASKRDTPHTTKKQRNKHTNTHAHTYAHINTQQGRTVDTRKSAAGPSMAMGVLLTMSRWLGDVVTGADGGGGDDDDDDDDDGG
jgi:hypothetical protein